MTADIRNIGILAHVDAGKTTLTEQLLFISGQKRAAGRVDDGTAGTDFLPVERRRGISVLAASASFEYGGTRINIIDTPGHPDFAAEVERSLSVIDGAVLIVSAVEGVQAQTPVYWDALRDMHIPAIIFINKTDRAGADADRVLAQLKGLPRPPVPVLLRAQNGETVWRSGADTDAAAALGEADEKAAELYISGCSDFEKYDGLLAAATSGCRVNPVLCGCAMRGEGIAELLEACVKYLPPPPAPEDGLSGVVFRIEHDKTMGRVAHTRLYGGSLSNRDAVQNISAGQNVKVSQIRRVSAGKQTDTGFASAGDIAALYGLGDVHVGDILGKKPDAFKEYKFAEPLLRVRVMPEKDEQLTPLAAALGELCEEDPALGLIWEKNERELHVNIMGSIQLEIIGSMLSDRFGLSAFFGKPSVIYKETPSKTGEGFVAYTMPKPCWAVLRFLIEPLPRGSGLQYEAGVRDDKLFYRYQNHVEKAVPDALRQGLSGWEVTDLKVSLTDGEHHTIHTHPLDFFVATPMGIMDGLKNCGTTLLEPLQTLRVTLPQKAVPALLSEITQMRGQYDTPVISGDMTIVECVVPVSSSLDFSVKLGMMSGGRGSVSARFAGYRECPPELGATTKYRGVNPLDRAQWILHARGAFK